MKFYSFIAIGDSVGRICFCLGASEVFHTCEEAWCMSVCLRLSTVNLSKCRNFRLVKIALCYFKAIIWLVEIACKLKIFNRLKKYPSWDSNTETLYSTSNALPIELPWTTTNQQISWCAIDNLCTFLWFSHNHWSGFSLFYKFMKYVYVYTYYWIHDVYTQSNLLKISFQHISYR